MPLLAKANLNFQVAVSYHVFGNTCLATRPDKCSQCIKDIYEKCLTPQSNPKSIKDKSLKLQAYLAKSACIENYTADYAFYIYDFDLF